MNIEAFLLCDSAKEKDGRLSVIDTLDTIYSPKTPVIYPGCSVAIRIRFDWGEEGKHSMQINCIDQDGKAIGPQIGGDMDVKISRKLLSAAFNFILNFRKMKFDRYGDYRIDLVIDGELVASQPLYVRPSPNRVTSGKAPKA